MQLGMNILKRLKSMLLKKIMLLDLVGNLVFKRTGRNKSNLDVSFYFLIIDNFCF